MEPKSGKPAGRRQAAPRDLNLKPSTLQEGTREALWLPFMCTRQQRGRRELRKAHDFGVLDRLAEAYPAQTGACARAGNVTRGDSSIGRDAVVVPTRARARGASSTVIAALAGARWRCRRRNRGASMYQTHVRLSSCTRRVRGAQSEEEAHRVKKRRTRRGRGTKGEEDAHRHGAKQRPRKRVGRCGLRGSCSESIL
eukprot:364791-Chlamydomonas_euryale.AAC.2